MRLRARRRRCLRDFDPIEQRLERRVVDLDVPRRIARRLGDLKPSPIEPFVKDRHPRAVEEQNLQRIASLAEEEVTPLETVGSE